MNITVPGGSGIFSAKRSVRSIRVKQGGGGELDHRSSAGARGAHRSPNALQGIPIPTKQNRPIPRRHQNKKTRDESIPSQNLPISNQIAKFV